MIVAVACGLIGGQAFGQSTFYYRGGTRTWSTGTNWWTTYLGTTTPAAGPNDANDMAVFNISGGTSAGTAVFNDNATVRGLVVLPAANAALTLRGDGVSNRTLTLGAGGIVSQPAGASTLTIGSTTANQGLNIVIGANQEWRRRTGSLTALNNITSSAASGASQTLVYSAPLSTGSFAGIISDSPTGGRTNLWLTVRDYAWLNRSSTLTGTLTVQSTGYGGNDGYGLRWAGGATSGTLAIQELQFAGGGLHNGSTGALTLSGSSTVRILGGASSLGRYGSLQQTGTIVRPVGGGFLAAKTGTSPSTSGIAGVGNDINLNGVIPWMLVAASNALPRVMYRAADGSIRQASMTDNQPAGVWGSVPNNSQLTVMADPTKNYGEFRNVARTTGANVATKGAIEYLGSSMSGSFFESVPDWIFDLNAQTWTANAFTSAGSITIMSSGGGGALVIGASGELIIQQILGGAPTISAPIRESVPNSWVTFGASPSFNSHGLGVLNLSGSNSHTGGTSLVSGSANINHAHALGSGTFRINGNNITIDNRSGGPLTLATNNLNEWNTDFTFVGTHDLNLGTGTVSLGTWAGSTRSVTVNAGHLTVGGRIVDGSFADLPTTGIAKQGDGTLILSGSNGYTGATESWGGELRFANRNALYGADTTKWTAANLVTGSGGVISVSVGSGAGSFTTADLDTLAAVGGDLGGYLGIDTTNVTGTYTYATSLADPAGGERVLGIAQTGAGTLILSGTNTFTGGVMARGGRLLVTGTEQVGPGTLVAGGGLLDMSGLTVANAFAITSGTIANTTIDAANVTANVVGPAVISGTLVGSGASGNLTKSGTGTLVLSAANTYSGTTTVSGGLLSISADQNLGSTARLVFNGGGLQVTGAALTDLNTGRSTEFTSNQPVAFDIVDPANTFTVSQDLTLGNGSLTKSGSGTLVVSGNNTYTGATILTGGTLRMGSATALGSGALLTVSGGVLDLNGNAVSRSGTVTFAGGLVTGGTLTATGTVDYQAQAGTVAASLAGTRGLVKSGTGVLILSGSNSYSGNTTLNTNAGILQFGGTTALYGGTTGNWTRTKITTGSGATLAVNVGGAGEFGTTEVTTLLTGVLGTGTNNGLLAGANIGFDTTNSGTAFTLADVIANTAGTGGGAIGLVKLGSGTLVLSASNTFTGPTVMGYYNGPNAGTLQLATTGYVSPTVVVYGGTFDTAGQNRTITTLSLGGGAPGSTASLQTGSGTATLGANGVTYVALSSPNGATIGGNLSLGGTTRTFLVNDSPAAAADLTVSAVISQGAAAGGLLKTGFGTLALTGLNTYTGKTVIGQGTVQIDSITASGASPLGTNTTVDLGAGSVAGTLRWVGATSDTLSRVLNLSGSTGGGGIDASGAGALVITSTVTAANGSKTLTLSGTSTAANAIGVIANPTNGSLAVVKDGPGRWRLTGTSTFNGGFTVNNGTVVAAVNATSSASGAFGRYDNTVTVGDATNLTTGTAALLADTGATIGLGLTIAGSNPVQTVLIGGINSSGTATYANNQRFKIGRDVTIVAATGGVLSFGGEWWNLSDTGVPAANITIGAPDFAGTVRLTQPGTLATTGSVSVRYGTAVLGANTILDGAGTLAIDSGATLAGIGTVAAPLGGAGLVAPGNSPGVMTAEGFDASGGLGLALEFTGTAAPTYANSANSLNDVLRLTGGSPFPGGSLDGDNVVNVYLPSSVTAGDVFLGGFFVDNGGSFASSIQGANWTYWVAGSGTHVYDSGTYTPLATFNPSWQVSIATIPQTSGTFANGDAVNGSVSTFTIVVPEPTAIALAGIGAVAAAWAARRRPL